MDFVHINSVGLCLQILPEMLVEKGVDNLQIPHLLWHAWSSLTGMLLANDTDAQAHVTTGNATHQGNAEKDNQAHRQAPRRIDGSRFTLKCPHPNCKAKRRTFDKYGLIGHL
jgi:hypothetical protein